MAQKQKIYEITFIVNAGLDDPQISAVVDKVRDLIIKNGGEVMELAKWGRKRFAYPIKKKNNGFYVVCEFKGPGELVARLERHFTLDENIIRFLVIALDKKALEARISGNDLLKQAAPSVASTSGSPLVTPSAAEGSEKGATSINPGQ
jgi:small subunit ribosomal protein S6